MTIITPWKYAEAGTEHAHQTALFMWASVAKRYVPELDLMFAIPNGGLRDKVTASRLKMEGVKTGVPDIFLPVPRLVIAGGMSVTRHGLFIEMKKEKGTVQDNQRDWQAKLIEQGYAWEVCYGWEQARYHLLAYLVGVLQVIPVCDAVDLDFQKMTG